MRKFYFVPVILLLLAGCTKEESKTPIEAQTFEVNATSSTTWKYFSFEMNDTLEISDPLNSTDWDLAFQRYRIRTNGGKSGNGLGKAANSYETGQAGFDALKIVPDTSTFVVDDTMRIAIVQGYATYIVNPKLYSWFSLEMATQGTQIVPSDYIYIVQTARGEFAKVWFKSYYSATNQSGYVTFQYKFQPDGSRNLE
jgi:hypothetical protein